MSISEEINRRFDLEADARNRYEELIRSVSQVVNKRHIIGLNAHKKVEFGLAAKGIKSWRAIANLFYSGFLEDAEIVLRALVDVVVNMKFISLDPKERAQRFIDYHAIHRVRWVRYAKESRLITSDVEISRIENDVNRAAEKVYKRRPEWRKNRPTSWSKESTRQKAKDINEQVFYMTFMQGSSYTHPNVVKLPGYFRTTNKTDEILTEPLIPENPRVFIDSCLYLQCLVEHLNQVVHLELDDRCQEWRKDVLEDLIRNRYPDSDPAKFGAAD